MKIWPAIDIRGGKCVRLQQGDYQRETVFNEDPLNMALRWLDAGAYALHLVDLDGARDGKLVNAPTIARIVEATGGTELQLGGGIRNEETIRQLLDLGIDRLVVGTQALKQPDWFWNMASRYSSCLVLGIDARDGWVATDGWLETSTTSAIELAQAYGDYPLAGIVYTDIAKDGMLAGPNLSAMQAMVSSTQFPVIASGGVTELNDIRQLAELQVSGCIIGRALYEGRLQLPDVFQLVEETES